MHFKARFCLITFLVLNLVFPSSIFAQGGITPGVSAGARQPGVNKAGNGVPVVDITTPSASGLSHNQYKDFNVGKNGVILNNNPQLGQSQLGGIINPNANLAGSGAAKLILNEVTGAGRSNIQGYIEVHGNKADVILANPNGITVNGGGFINTGRAALTTGRPDVNGGVLKGFDVRQGSIKVEGTGINAENLTAFDIVSRAAEINAQVHAQDLTITTGQNRYDYTNRTTTPLVDDGSSKPAVAIDSSALGGMYAGRIVLTSTEKGVGVNLDSVMQSTADMHITADGKLVVNAAKSAGNMHLAAGSGELSAKQALVAGNNMQLSGKSVNLNGSSTIASSKLNVKATNTASLNAAALQGNVVNIEAGQLNISGSTVASGTALNITANTLNVSGSRLAGQKTSITSSAKSTLEANSTVSGQQSLAINAADLALTNSTLASGGSLGLGATQGLKAEGSNIGANGNMLFNAADIKFINSNISTDGNMFLSAADIKFMNTNLLAEGSLGLSASRFSLQGNALTSLDNVNLNTLSGSLFAGDAFSLTASESLSLSGGLLGSDTLLAINAPVFNYTAGSAIFSSDALTLQSGNLELKSLLAKSGGNLSLTVNNLSLTNNYNLSAGGVLGVTAAGNITVAAGSALLGFEGLELQATNLTNRGLIYSGANSSFRLSGTLSNLDGADILGIGNMHFTGITSNSRMASLHNQAASVESLNGNIRVDADLFFNDGGTAEVRKEIGEKVYNVIGGSFYLKKWIDSGGEARRIKPRAVLEEGEEVDYTFPTFGYDLDGNKNYATAYTPPVFGDQLSFTFGPYSKDQVATYVAEMAELLGIPADIPLNIADGLQEWREYSQDVLVNSNFAPASFMAAGDIQLNVGTLKNMYSTLSAGANMEINATTLQNQGLELTRYIDIERMFLRRNANQVDGIRDTQLKTYSIKEVYSSIPATITAGGNLILNVVNEVNNSSIKSGVAYLGTGSAPLNFSTGQVAGTGSSYLPSFPTLLPPSGVFTLSSNPNHPYLIETNPALTSLKGYYGSEYFFSQLGFDFNKQQTKLLGDAFYETRLVREQILAQTGQRFLFAGITDDAKTMRMLMDNAAAAGKALGLSVGIALSPQQIANLSKDIIWLEETEYNGQKVLVPRLYLCDATKAELEVRGSNLTAGGTLVVDAGDIKTNGVIRAKNTQLYSATDIINQGGSIKGTDILFAQADGSIINQNGKLNGGELTLSAGKDIVLETITSQSSGNEHNKYGAETTAYVGGMAAVQATGELIMQAGNNITLKGAQVSSEGLTALDAGNDISISGVQVQNRTVSKYGYSETTNVLTSSVSAGDLSIKAGRDIAIVGSGMAAKGDAALQAGRDLTLTTLEASTDYYHREKGRKRENIVASQSVQNIGSSVLAGGNLSLKAGADAAQGKGNITLVGSQAAAVGDASLTATGNVIIANATDTDSFYQFKKRKGLLNASSSTTLRETTSVAGSSVSGNNISIVAGDNILVTGSGIDARNDLGLTAVNGDIIVSAAQSSFYEKKQKVKSNFSLKSLVKSPLSIVKGDEVVIWSKTDEKSKETATFNAGSILTAGNNMKLDAGRDVSVIGSMLAANNDLGLKAGRDVNIIPGQESHDSEYSKKTAQIGLWTSANINNIGSFAGLKVEDKGVNSTGSYSAGSLVQAGNDVVIEAGRNLNQVGSDIRAGQDAIINVGQDWNMTSAFNEESLDQYVKNVQVGINASIKQNVTSAVETVSKLPQNATAGRGGGGYSAATAAGAGMQAIDAVSAAVNSPVSASISLGSNYSKNNHTADATTALGSSISAGRDIIANAGRDINIEGSQAVAGRDIVLGAGRDVNIISSQNTSSSKSSSESGGASVGIKATVGSGGVALGINVAANAAGSKGKATGTSNNNSLVLAGNDLIITSGRDTTIAGAHVEGERVGMDVGGNLTVASVQDTYNSKSSNWSAGADVTVGYGVNISGNIGGGKAKQNSDWTIEQTAIVGREVVDIYVEDNTHLKGAVIATNPGGKLTLDTNTITFEEIHDKDKGSSWQGSIAGGFSVEGGFEKPAEGSAGSGLGSITLPGGKELALNWQDNTPQGGTNVAEKPGTYLPDSGALDYSANDRRGVLRPTVTEGDIIVRSNPNAATDGTLDGLNRNLEDAREITKDKNVNMNAYVSKQAIEEIMSGGEGIRKGIETYSELISQVLANDSKVDAAEEAVETLLDDPELSNEDKNKVRKAAEEHKEKIQNATTEKEVELADAELKDNLESTVGTDKAGATMEQIQENSKDPKEIEEQTKKRLTAIAENTAEDSKKEVLRGAIEVNTGLFLVDQIDKALAENPEDLSVIKSLLEPLTEFAANEKGINSLEDISSVPLRLLKTYVLATVQMIEGATDSISAEKALETAKVTLNYAAGLYDIASSIGSDQPLSERGKQAQEINKYVYTVAANGISDELERRWGIVTTVPGSMVEALSNGDGEAFYEGLYALRDALGDPLMQNKGKDLGDAIIDIFVNTLNGNYDEAARSYTNALVNGADFTPGGKTANGAGTVLVGMGAIASNGGKKAANAINKAVDVKKAAEVTVNPRKELISGRVQSRINISNEGIAHTLSEHLNTSKSKSQFTITELELRELLTKPEVIKAPVKKDLNSGNYYRTIELEHFIGTDKFDNFNQTKYITIFTDKAGNLKTVFPGKKD